MQPGKGLAVTVADLPSPARYALLRSPARLLARIRGEAAAERERWPLFVPVAIGTGIGLYFALPAEPALAPLLGVMLVGIALALFVLFGGQRRFTTFAPDLLLLGIAVALMGGGLTAAKLRTDLVAAPVLEKRIGPVSVSGRIASVEDRATGRRLVFERVTIPGLPAAKTPERVRVSLRGREPELIAGQWARVLAILSPPPAPAAPGAYDFQREAYFKGLGAVGFGIGEPARIVPHSAAAQSLSLEDRFLLGLSRLRYDITARVQAGIGRGEGAVAAALMTGEQAGIPDDIITAMRISGLAHLLAVSGFNFVLITGMLFFLVRAFLALVPPIALRFPTKKWAAAGALLGGVGYFAITGDSIATERAFIMVSLVFLAVMVDRNPISMRTLAWAAILVLLIQPESLLGASFQLSFAAVTALIAVYEGWGGRAFESAFRGAGADGGTRRWLRIALAYLAGICLTTLVATLATAPLLIYHFNRFATYGLLSNLLAVPLTAAWIMPWALVAFVLMPFGLEQFALVPMGWGVRLLVRIAETIAGFPGAYVPTTAVPEPAVVVIVAGGLWLCLWRRRWRLAGLPVIAAGFLVWAFARPPDILVDESAKLMAVRAADGRMLLSSRRAAKFHAETWLRRAGQAEGAPFPEHGVSRDGSLACDPRGCLYRARGRIAALAMSEAAVAEDCGAVDLMASLRPVRVKCPGPVVDRFDLWRWGSYAIWLDPGSIKIASVREWQGRRPWVPDRRPKRIEKGDGALSTSAAARRDVPAP